jgi:seryl-tRNA synthetase
MHDLRALRDDPAAFDKGWAERGLAAQTPAILELDGAVRACQTALQADQSRRNQASKAIGQARASGDTAKAQALTDEVEKLKLAIAIHSRKETERSESLREILAGLPNLPAADVPPGREETDNVGVRRWGAPFAPAKAKDHVELGGALGMMDFEIAARIAGSRFVVLRGELARLERALGQFMIDMQTQEHGYLEIAPPLLVRQAAMFGSGQLPKFADDLFATTDGRWLIPTAEVPLANLVRERLMGEDELPLRLTALTP